jgi:hypothetical protein
MNTYGFTMKADSGELYSWIVEGNNRRHAFDQLQQGDKPDTLLILTGRLSTEQRHRWVQAATEHGGFGDQMARSVLGTY